MTEMNVECFQRYIKQKEQSTNICTHPPTQAVCKKEENMHNLLTLTD